MCPARSTRLARWLLALLVLASCDGDPGRPTRATESTTQDTHLGDSVSYHALAVVDLDAYDGPLLRPQPGFGHRPGTIHVGRRCVTFTLGHHSTPLVFTDANVMPEDTTDRSFVFDRDATALAGGIGGRVTVRNQDLVFLARYPSTIEHVAGWENTPDPACGSRVLFVTDIAQVGADGNPEIPKAASQG